MYAMSKGSNGRSLAGRQLLSSETLINMTSGFNTSIDLEMVLGNVIRGT